MCQLKAFYGQRIFPPKCILCFLQFKIDSTFRIQLTFDKDTNATMAVTYSISSKKKLKPLKLHGL